jgi:hypothetical protein
MTCLGIAAPANAARTPVPQPNRDAYMDSLRQLLPVLREHAIRSITVSSDSSGDSGSIEYADYAAPDGFDASAITLAPAAIIP